jgi:hypothetical protein
MNRESRLEEAYSSSTNSKTNCSNEDLVMYQLSGIEKHNDANNSIRTNGSVNIAAIEAPHNPDEEKAYLREAIKNSLAEEQKAAGAGSPPAISAAGNDLLLDFLEGPV